MDTLKTAVIVVLLLAVVYGAYVVLSKPDTPLPQEIAWHEQKSSEPLQIDLGKAEPQAAADQIEASTAKFDSMWPAENKANGPSPSSHTEGATEKSTAANGEIHKPSVAGQTSSAPPTNLGADTSSAYGKTDLAPPAAPSLLGAGSTPDTTLGSDSSNTKNVPNSGLPSLPELRSSPAVENKLSTETTDSTTSTKDTGSLARLDPSSATESSLGKADEPVRPSATSSASTSGTPDPAVGPIGESSPSGESSRSVTTAAVYDAALREANLQMDEGKWHSALFTLTKFIHSPDLSPDQNNQLYDLLDPLAAKVIYSPEHLVESAYEVRRGDRLADIAQTYQLPWELLANINAIENRDVLVPGTKLKVVRGPFRAEVNLQTSELTLFAGQLYAGRFPISVGTDPAPKPGEYRVLEKQQGRVYYAGDGRTIAAEDSSNPYGRVWLGLGNELSIHSSPEGGEARGMGCISLSPLDATDVYCILSQGSSVVIRR